MSVESELIIRQLMIRLVSILLLACVGLLLPGVVTQQREGKLVFVQEIFRHGARNPYQILGIGDEYAAAEHSLGELTTQGKSMHYLLGRKMYDTYWKRLFAGTPYEFRYNQSKFYVKSTDVNRTIESAQSHIYGLLENIPHITLSEADLPYSHPPYPGAEASAGPVYGKGTHVHPIPIHITGQNMNAFDSGDFLARFLASDCPNQNKWMKQNFQDPKVQKMLNNSAYQAALLEFSKSINKPVSVNNFSNYYDNLECMEYRGVPVPSLFTQPSETKRALQSLHTLSSFVKFYSGDRQIRAAANDLFNETILNMRRIINNPEAVQWVLYSAHDITIGIALGIMNMWNEDCIYDAFLKNITKSEDCVTEFPIFSSLLVFELYSYGEQYTFKVNYNGQHRKIPFCEGKVECPLERLESWFESWKVRDIKAACGVPYYYTKETALVTVGLAVVSLIFYLYEKVKSSKKQKKA